MKEIYTTRSPVYEFKFNREISPIVLTIFHDACLTRGMWGSFRTSEDGEENSLYCAVYPYHANYMDDKDLDYLDSCYNQLMETYSWMFE